MVSDVNNVAKSRNACSNTVKCDGYFHALTAIATAFHLDNRLRIARKDESKQQIATLSLKGRRALLALCRKHKVLDLVKLVSSFSKESGLTD